MDEELIQEQIDDALHSIEYHKKQVEFEKKKLIWLNGLMKKHKKDLTK